MVLDPAPGAGLLREYLARSNPGEVWIAAGPEGGFTGEELGSWMRRGWSRAGLGPRTLRTESAGLATATLVLHRWGDLG